MILTTFDALMADILANPADDFPRLAYADYLTDRGEPGDEEKAEFIRTQCELAIAPGGICNGASWHTCSEQDRAECNRLMRRKERLQRCERELLARDFTGWFGDGWPVCQHVPGCPLYTTWRRGFVAEVKTDLRGFCGLDGRGGHGREIVHAQPIESVVLTCREPTESQAFPGRFGWWTEKRGGIVTQGSDALPWPLARHLQGPVNREQIDRDLKEDRCAWYWYEGERLALVALIAAALTLAREAAPCPT